MGQIKHKDSIAFDVRACGLLLLGNPHILPLSIIVPITDTDYRLPRM